MIDLLATIGVTIFDYLFKDDPVNTVAITILFGLVGYVLYKNKKKTGHDNCVLADDHNNKMSMSYERGLMVSKIREHDTVYEQMVVIRLYSEQVKTILFRIFLSLLPENGITEKQRSSAKIDYRKDLKIALDEASGYLRKWVKTNHFAEKTDVEFNNYIQLRASEVIDKVTEVLDTYYLSSVCIIDREELRKANYENISEINLLIGKMFFEIREIAEQKQAEMEKILNDI